MCFSAIVKAKTYNTGHYLQSGYHGDTRRAGLIHWEGGGRVKDQEGERGLFVWVKGGKVGGICTRSSSVREFLSSAQLPEHHKTHDTVQVSMRHNES